MNDCIFCKIVHKEIPAEIFYEDAETMAFMDIRANNPGHSLVIPKQHYSDIFDSTESDVVAISKTIRKVAPAIKEAVNADGINIISNNGESAGQIIFHSHTHIIPRFKNDGFTHWPQKNTDAKEREMLANKIKEKIG